ncbi:hypothetical protein [Sphingopyxis witflariensis]|uniref:Uncharacterized protein n=1 Tax=Sphingopyxis witflariensis TaxID=173675 RepID=A0A246JUS4_9SPHN|nr:hypothetical protein [Sphingopyxis witflariensis]OWQ96266.1 hypothetical protein CDQ91_12170 [Sphingopyxis witflariensis]
MTTNTAASAKRATLFWVTAFMVGMIAAGLLIISGDFIQPPWGMAVMLLPMLLLIPMVRAPERMQRATGSASPAAMRYSRRMLAASFAYVIGFLIAVALFDDRAVSKSVAATLSLLPTLGTFGMIWAMTRYVIEESDEYLRARTVNAALMATGLLLAIGTFWGFLTTFGVAPHVPTWAVVPMWAIGLAVGQLVNKVRGA